MRALRGVFALVLALALSVPVLAADWVEAYQREDYAMALKEIRPLAEQGDVRAQAQLGLMYWAGLGVPEDDAEAAKWYRLAAEQGDQAAQFNLGSMYLKGRGVIKDYVQAHMWFNIAAALCGGVTYRLDLVEQLMTPNQLAEAQRLAREWKPK